MDASTESTSLSIVRQNLLSRPGYTPYCGNEKCFLSWPRTHWDRQKRQFACYCGWCSQFDEAFIQQLNDKWGGFL